MRREHYLRPPLPWHSRADRETACGRPVPDDVEWRVVPSTMGAWHSKPAELCQQCWHRRGFLASWDEDPGEAISQWAGSRVAERTNDELRRIGRIFEAHRDEYDAEVALEALAGERR